MKTTTTTIQLNGQEYPFYAGLSAFADACDACELSLVEFLDRFDFGGYTMKQMIVFVWAALKQGHRLEGKEFKLSVYDVGDLMEVDFAAVDVVFQHYERVMARISGKPEDELEDAEKKVMAEPKNP